VVVELAEGGFFQYMSSPAFLVQQVAVHFIIFKFYCLIKFKSLKIKSNQNKCYRIISGGGVGGAGWYWRM
jgi:hypothetical protein